MVATTIISDTPTFITRPEGRHAVNIITEVALPPITTEMSTDQAAFSAVLKTSQQQLCDSLRRGREHPKADNFTACTLLSNTFHNELQGMEVLELNKDGMALLAQMTDELESIVASESLLLATTANSPTSETPMVSISDRGLCDKIRDLMNDVKDDYLSVFESAVEVQMTFWREFTETQAMLAKYTSASGSDIKIEVKQLRDELNKYISNIAEKYVIYPNREDLWWHVTQEDAIKWAKALGIPESNVRFMTHYILQDGFLYKVERFGVTVDIEPLEKMLSDLNALTSGDSITMNPAKYQAWLTGFNAHVENIKTSCQTITTKYSSANSLYDSLIKLLTSTITTMTESAKEYLKF
ncbi:IpaD/SipD/SspD family type III secretion system needle tip protein [Yersinia enterocolitica]|uniref:IpaD/SipD/SspD family type III secretion system needle tip protein n=1 Tax=Yersinia enterocolitica TaxID=630 RepID=UPI00398CD85E